MTTEDDGDQSMEDDALIPDPDPRAITVINDWLDLTSNYGSDEDVVANKEYTARELAAYAGVPVDEASNMLQSYRYYNYWMDERCMYVLAHEGRYGAGSPWRLQSTGYDVPETTRRLYRLNQIRHMTWDFVDHAKKSIKSFGSEIRQALIHVDSMTGTVASQRQRLAVRDYARDLLQSLQNQAQSRAQTILDTLNVPKAMREEYLRYFFDGFWPYIQIMVDEEVEILERVILGSGRP